MRRGCASTRAGPALPRASLAAPEAWLDGLRAERAVSESRAERLTQGWSLTLLIGFVLYILIGPNPYKHVVELDPATGGAMISPVNRFAWLALAAAAAPLLWRRRAQLKETLGRQGLLLGLFGWFALTMAWALDHASAERRLFLYLLTLVCALALSLGFGDSRRLHRGLAIACAVMVGIDLFSWVALPGMSMTDLGLAAIHMQKNALGAAMLFCGLVVGPYLFTQTHTTGRIVWGGVLLAALVLLAASQSKTSISIVIVAGAITPLVVMLLKRPLELSRALLAGVVLLVAAAVMAWLAGAVFAGLDPTAPLAGVNFSRRTELWAFMVDEIAKRPFTGAGFGSFWDVDPHVQPSLQGELWFGSPDVANEAHNGYLDLLAATGVIGFGWAMLLLFRWIGRALADLRWSLLLPPSTRGPDWPAALMLALFPVLIFVHNFMESTLFVANEVFGSLILLIGVEIDRRRRGRKRESLLPLWDKEGPIA